MALVTLTGLEGTLIELIVTFIGPLQEEHIEEPLKEPF